MPNDIPAYMRGRGTGLIGFDDVDTGKAKPWAAERDPLSIHSLPVVERAPRARPSAARDPDWLLKGEPREVQLEALRRSYMGYALRDRADDVERYMEIRSGPAKGWGHFMEMRLGKTPTALNEFELFRRDHGFKRAIILAPNAFKRMWPIEADTFGSSVEAYAFDSNRKREFELFLRRAKGQFILSINYESLKSEWVASILEEYCDRDTYLGADESISIKGHNSKQTSVSLDLAKRCGARRPLTGKPITQGPHDIYPQLRFAAHLSGKLFTEFKTEYCKMGGFQGKQIVGVKKPEELSEIIRSASFVARKVDWLKTPGRDYGSRSFEMTGEQKRLYDTMEEDFIVELQNGTFISADQIVTKLLKMQQISSGVIFDETRQWHYVVPPSANPKLQGLLRMLEEEIEGKVIVVSHYQPTMEMLAEALAKYQPAIIRGQEWHRKNKRTVEEEKARFNADPACRVLIGQEQALRYGHTLMGNPQDPCYTTVFFENNYSLNDRSQCEERNQGAGQQYPIAIIDFFASDRDRKIVAALQAKENVAALLMQYDRATGVLPLGL